MIRKQIPVLVKHEVKNRFGGRCGYCGHKPKVLQIDHVVPVRDFWSGEGDYNDPKNLMPACHGCNNYKMTHDLEFFRMQLGEQIRRLRENSVNFRLAERFGQVNVKEAPIEFYFERVAREALEAAAKELG